MHKFYLTLIVLLLPLINKAQNKIPEMVTDRPDQTESSSTVPAKSLQIETGYLKENNADLKAFAYNTTLLRYGLLSNFELRLGLDYLGIKKGTSGFEDYRNMHGFSPLYTGFKTKIADEKGWRPEMAFLGGLVLPFTADKNFKPSYSAAAMRFALSHTLSEKLSLGYNLGAEWDGETAVTGFYYSVVLGIGLSEKLGMFVESYGLAPEKGKGEHLLDMGFTYLVLPNFQLDLSGGLGMSDAAIDNFISVGLSYRIPN